ncbi:hypothetical protein BAE44_0012992, partial [Dichanthelium oligosanthes]
LNLPQTVTSDNCVPRRSRICRKSRASRGTWTTRSHRRGTRRPRPRHREPGHHVPAVGRPQPLAVLRGAEGEDQRGQGAQVLFGGRFLAMSEAVDFVHVYDSHFDSPILPLLASRSPVRRGRWTDGTACK